MELKDVRAGAISPALALLPAKMNSPQALVMMFAIGLQESEFKHQRQHGGGPAHGLWQFERPGGVAGVLNHPASREHALRVCAALKIKPTAAEVHEALAGTNDVLDAAFSRLLLWTGAKPLPALGDVWGAWAYYLDLWRPGKPHKKKWAANYARALAEVQG